MRSSIPSVGLSVFLAAVSASASARTDLNSFVNRKVTDTNSLVKQVRTDPEVSDRYERHFAMDRRELITYLSSLHRGKLASEGVYTIYSVPEGGRVKMHVGKLKVGEPMFFDAEGKPTLIAKCGNPVVLGPSRVRRGNPVASVPTEESGTREYAEVEPREADVENPYEVVALMPPVPEVIPPTASVAENPAPVVETPSTVPATSSGGKFPWLAGLPILIPLIGAINHGGDGGGTIPTPEPASLLVLGAGAAALVRRRTRK